jgi:hypothetical protein
VWFHAIALVLNGRKGISSLQLAREIGVTAKTGWRVLQQIRIAMGNEEQTKVSCVIMSALVCLAALKYFQCFLC